ncbi:MAG: Threonylcarbamoyladenosine tRNA methylthiotransferase MtaB [Myxococcota bacterium]|nr:Threonylcarbamoyladenosine tRNA methylthiotransferase MtaB [Myxococcota bacterium]
MNSPLDHPSPADGRWRVAVHTLGCKVNQYDSAVLASHLEASRYQVVEDAGSADALVLNTCTVTHRAGADAGQIVRRFRRLNPHGRVILTGCFASGYPAEAAAIAGVDAVVSNEDKGRAAQLVAELLGEDPLPAVDTFDFDAPLLNQLGHTRPFIKIQDGCNSLCSYCIIPTTRGPSRSRPAESILRQLRAIDAQGAPEVVLTGIHMGTWGRDLPDRPRLAGLLREIVEDSTTRFRVRLSSIEPMEFPRELIDLAADHPRVCNHLHIPLQSGGDGVLRAMRRPYRREDYRRLMFQLHERIPGLCAGIDVIAGFPGEDEAAFESTLRLLEEIPWAYLHVFSFSPRPGTSAAEMPNQVDPTVISRRAEVLRKLSLRRRREFYRSQLGQAAETVIERETSPLWRQGCTSNYIPVRFMGPVLPAPGSRVRARLTALSREGVLGEVIAD